MLVVGDSVALEVSSPMDYALELGGSAVVDFASVPSVPSVARDAARHGVWQRALADYRPEVVVVLVGYWEAAVLGARSPDALPPAGEYARGVLAPFASEASQVGAHVLWVSPPLVRDPAQAAVFAELAQRFAAFAGEDEAVTLVDGNTAVAAPDGRFTEVLDGPRGLERVRVADGLHLCPDGAARLAAMVMATLQAGWNVPPVGSDWPDGAWRRRGFTAAADCPPP